jgi:hypothetical protein
MGENGWLTDTGFPVVMKPIGVCSKSRPLRRTASQLWRKAEGGPRLRGHQSHEYSSMTGSPHTRPKQTKSTCKDRKLYFEPDGMSPPLHLSALVLFRYSKDTLLYTFLVVVRLVIPPLDLFAGCILMREMQGGCMECDNHGLATAWLQEITTL